jgi:hypothetical protein
MRNDNEWILVASRVMGYLAFAMLVVSFVAGLIGVPLETVKSMVVFSCASAVVAVLLDEVGK